MLVRELQFGIVGCPAHRENREQSPRAHAFFDKVLAQGGQLSIVMFGDTGDDIVLEIGSFDGVEKRKCTIHTVASNCGFPSDRRC